MKRTTCTARGFSLVEVVLALAISVFSLVIILGLLPAGMGTNQVSIQQTEAINLATAVVADLRQTPSATAISDSNSQLTSLSPRYGIDVTKSSTTFYLDPSGNGSSTLTSSSRYRVTISLTQPSTGQRNSTYGTLVIGWPASATATLNSVSAFIALDRN